jgi:DNA-binding response OmpR family regulator
LLDITLPDGNGLDILRELKSSDNAAGVIIISAKNALDDKIAGLNLGADDYIAKPFHLSELSARIAAVIRRRQFNGNSKITTGEFYIDTDAKTVFVNGNKLDITKTQYELLLYFIVNKNRVLSKMEIAEHLSGEEAEYYDSLDVVYAHIKNLKKKIAAAGDVKITDFILAIKNYIGLESGIIQIDTALYGLYNRQNNITLQ